MEERAKHSLAVVHPTCGSSEFICALDRQTDLRAISYPEPWMSYARVRYQGSGYEIDYARLSLNACAHACNQLGYRALSESAELTGSEAAFLDGNELYELPKL